MFKDVHNKETASSLLYKYKKRNIIVQIRKNVYLPTNPADGFVDENKYEIGCNSVPNAYISYHSAMEYYGLQNQVFNRIYLSTPKRFRAFELSLIHISEPTRQAEISYAVFCLKKFFFLMIRRPPRSTRKESSAASDVYKRQNLYTNPEHYFQSSPLHVLALILYLF